jgi:hypothetical protein
MKKPPMEDELKLLKAEYLSNHLLDHTQFWNLSLYDQTIFCQCFNEDDLKILKKEYLSSHLLVPTHI